MLVLSGEFCLFDEAREPLSYVQPNTLASPWFGSRFLKDRAWLKVISAEVMSPEKLSYVAWNFITLNNILASLLHIYCDSFVSSKIKEQDILLIYRATFVVHQGLTSGMYYT